MSLCGAAVSMLPCTWMRIRDDIFTVCIGHTSDKGIVQVVLHCYLAVVVIRHKRSTWATSERSPLQAVDSNLTLLSSSSVLNSDISFVGDGGWYSRSWFNILCTNEKICHKSNLLLQKEAKRTNGTENNLLTFSQQIITCCCDFRVELRTRVLITLSTASFSFTIFPCTKIYPKMWCNANANDMECCAIAASYAPDVHADTYTSTIWLFLCNGRWQSQQF